MSERTTIEWTHHTFNPWWGCTNISPGCERCYAESWAKRFGVKWGVGETRKPASERTWAEPYRWNKKAQQDGVRRRVFCASMADVFDNEGPAAEREWLWEVIAETPNLDWLLLTKRVGNVMSMVPASWQQGFPSHVWMGATMVNQPEFDRDVDKLRAIPAPIHFISFEPLLGVIDARGRLDGIHWAIVGAESGRNARPCEVAWVRSLRDQCESAGVSFFYKQMVRDGIKTPTPELDGKRWVEVPEVLFPTLVESHLCS